MLNKVIFVLLYSSIVFGSVSSMAGVRQDVYSELEKMTGNWSDAGLSVSVAGVTGEASVSVGDSINYDLSSNHAGYFILMHVDSHGAVSLILPDCPSAMHGPEYKCSYPGDGALKVQPPLGKETLYVVFTETAISRDSIGVRKGESFVQFKDSVALASKIRQVFRDYANTGKVAVSKKEYLVEGAPGTTQYTTRAIIRQFDDGEESIATPAAVRKSLSVNMIQFEFGSAQLTTQGKINLDLFGEAFLSGALSEQVYILAGHTDDVGEDKYNEWLSLERAKSAKAYLVEHFGIQENRIEVRGFGKSNPLTPNQDDKARAMNRRVEFVRVE